jgi:O-antigen/teichoic acid export membrane protein
MVIAAARLFAAVLGIAVPIVLVRSLDQTEFGQYKQVFLVVTTLASVLSFALPSSLYYLVARHPNAGPSFLAQTFVALCAAGALAGGLIYAAAAVFASFVHTEARDVLVWSALLAALSVPASLLPIAPAVERRARLAGLLIAGSDLSRGLAMVVAALVFGTVASVLAAAAGVALLATMMVGSYVIRSRRHARLARGNLREQVNYCAPMAASSYVGLVREQYHAFYVGAAFNPAQFAVYSVGTMNVPLIGQVSSALADVLVLEASRHYSNGSLEELRRVWHRVTDVHALVMVPVAVVLAVFADDLVVVLYGRAYEEAAAILRVFLILLPLRIAMTSPMMRATGDSRGMLLADLFSLAATLASAPVFVREFGPVGAVGSLLVGSLVFQVVAARRIAKVMGVGVGELMPIGRWTRLSLLCGACTLPPWFFLLAAPAPARLLLGGALAGSAYTVAVLKLHLVPPGEREMVLGTLARWLPERWLRRLG